MSVRNGITSRAVTGELIVPAIMLLFVAIYWLEAVGLSGEALAFPAALTAVIIAASAIVIAPIFIRSGKTEEGEEAETDRGRVMMSVKTWIIVLLPLLLVFVWRQVGALPVLFLYAVCILVVLGERKPLRLVIVPSSLAIALVFLFKKILYVRLPDMPWAFGG